MSPFEELWEFGITYLAISLYCIRNPFCSWIESRMKTWILRSTHLRMPQVQISHQVGICLHWSSFNYFKTAELLLTTSDRMWSSSCYIAITLTMAQWSHHIYLPVSTLLEIRIICRCRFEIKVISFGVHRHRDYFWITISILNTRSGLTLFLFGAVSLRRSQRPRSFDIIALWKRMMRLSLT